MADRHQTIVALFSTRDAAYLAKQDLEANGIPSSSVTVSMADSTTQATGTTTQTQATPRREPGFWESLFGTEEDYDVPETHRTGYETAYQRGQAVLTVRAIDTHAEFARIAEIINRHAPINLNEDTEYASTFGGYDRRWDEDDYNRPAAGTTATAAAGPAASTTATARTGAGSAAYASTAGAATARTGGTTEEVIPVAKEELTVGKTPVHNVRSYRIRTTVKEVPVEQDVTLKDEKVTVERRPATTGVTDTGEAFRERTVDVHETREEPVVSKRVVGQEEVVISKDTTERVETVRDTVRETQVDIEKTGDKDDTLRRTGGSKPGTPGTTGSKIDKDI